MDTTSEYSFPIFISSTDYNLKDLRAELARFLSELGYRPILSSAEGFPDNSPTLEPWESCLPVLDRSFVVILIIDGKYGIPLNWPHFKEFFDDKKVSPTHGEYIFAHHNRKRMLVFIRKDLMPHYQSYKTAFKKCEGDKIKAKALLDQTLPDYVSFETLDFINDVKTTKPIPWIVEFDDVTSVKKEVQKKMLNELAELFLIKNKHFEVVIESFNKVMDSLTIAEQKNALHKVNATKDILEAVDKLESYKKDLELAKTELVEAKKSNSNDKTKYEEKIKTLTQKISALEAETLKSSNSEFYIKNGQVQLGNPNFIDASGSVFNGLTASSFVTGINTLSSGSVLLGRKCDQCGKQENYGLGLSTGVSYVWNQYHTCPSCNRYLCNDCWPHTNPFSSIGYASLSSFENKKCPKCVKEGK